MQRAEADRVLAERAWERVTASDSSAGEKAAAWTVTNLMKAKAKFGGGAVRRKRRRTAVKKKKRSRKSTASAALRRLKSLVGRGLYLRPYKTGGGASRKKKRRRH